jgi:hypothetical protein
METVVSRQLSRDASKEVCSSHCHGRMFGDRGIGPANGVRPLDGVRCMDARGFDDNTTNNFRRGGPRHVRCRDRQPNGWGRTTRDRDVVQRLEILREVKNQGEQEAHRQVERRSGGRGRIPAAGCGQIKRRWHAPTHHGLPRRCQGPHPSSHGEGLPEHAIHAPCAQGESRSEICDLIAPPGLFTIVGYGNWGGPSASFPISRRFCGPQQAVKRELRRRRMSVGFRDIDEFRTSILDSETWQRMENMVAKSRVYKSSKEMAPRAVSRIHRCFTSRPVLSASAEPRPRGTGTSMRRTTSSYC